MQSVTDRHKQALPDPLEDFAKAVASRLRQKKGGIGPRTVLSALHESLDGIDPQSRASRLALQVHVANISDQLLAQQPPLKPEQLISTEEAAAILKCSRPYVAMLIDQGQFAGSLKSAGGHRKVPLSSVLEWQESHRTECNAGSADYKSAAKTAGMYRIPEKKYTETGSGPRKTRRG